MFHIFLISISIQACRLCPQTTLQPQGITGCPVLSILEGGYDLNAIAESAAAHVQVLFRDIATPPSVLPPSFQVSTIKEDDKSAGVTPLPALYPANLQDLDSSSEEEEEEGAIMDENIAMMMESLHMYIGESEKPENGENKGIEQREESAGDDEDIADNDIEHYEDERT